MMHAPLLATSSLAMAAASGAGLVLPLCGAPIGLGIGIAALCGLSAAMLTRWRDVEVVTAAARDSLPLPVAPEHTRIEPRFAPWPVADAGRPPVRELTLDADFVRPEPRLVPHVFAEGDAVEFTFSEFERGDITYRGTIAMLYRHARAKVVCEHVTVNAPLDVLTFVGDA